MLWLDILCRQYGILYVENRIHHSVKLINEIRNGDDSQAQYQNAVISFSFKLVYYSHTIEFASKHCQGIISIDSTSETTAFLVHLYEMLILVLLNQYIMADHCM